MQTTKGKPSDIDVMCAVIRLGQRAHGLETLEDLKSRGFRTSLAALYRTLERLEDGRLLASEFGEPIAERGGRRKRLFQLTGECVRELTVMLPLIFRKATS